MIAWSFGGGVQSAAIAVLVREGVLPNPDLAVIADTSRERQATWDYLRDVIQPYLSPIGLEIEIAPHSLANVDLYAKNGNMLIPAYTETGRLPTFCSGEWKRDACERWLRSKGVKTCTLWLGFSLDERHRCKKAHRPWCQPAWPLIDKGITRTACLRLVEAAGLPRPPKSRCWCCPHQNAEEWADVAADPDEWAKAVALDDAIREADERGGLFLHSSRVPLSMADLTVPVEDAGLFRHCQDAGCWT